MAMAMLGAFASSQVVALGLGEIELNSALNQPFNAEVELLSATDAELQELKVNLGSPDAFAKAGIDRPMFLSKLKFDVTRKADGSAVIRVTSRDVVREPFLDFLLELSWSKGRLLREYTVLVDPPVTMPAPAPVTQAPVQSVSRAGTAPAAAPSVARSATSQPVYAAPGEYGPTKRNDTLWNIATQVRPDRGVSVEQTMLGIQRANPEAFVNNNINNLKAGYVLRVPSREQLTSISRGEAARNARAQYDAWLAARSTSVAAAPSAAESVSTSDGAQAPADPVSAPESSLQLVSPEEAGAGGAGEDALEKMQRELIMANEALEEQRRQGEEMSGRLSMLEEQIVNMQRLIQLKDSELARLQSQSSIDGFMSTDTVEGEQAGEVETTAETAATEEVEAVAETVASEEAAEAPMGEAEIAEQTGMEASVAEDAGEAEVDPELPVEPGMESETMAVDGAETEVAEEPVPDEAAAMATPETEAVAAVELPVSEPEPPVTATSSEFIQRLLDNPLWLGAGGVVLALLAFFGLRRKRGVETEFQESILQAAQGDSTLGDSEIVSSGSDASAVKTAESSLLSEFAVSDMGALKSDGEADPLAEADVYLAYGRFQQAEDLIKEGLKKDSEREDLNLKLLEVFLAGKNQAAFDEHAQTMLAKLENTGSPTWEKIAEMGRELSPENPLYKAAEAPETEADELGDVDTLSDEDLDFNMDSGELDQAEEAVSGDTDAETAKDEGLDFDIDLSFESAKEDEPDSVEFTPPEAVDETPEVKVDMDSVEPDMVDQDSPLDIDLEDFDMDVSDSDDEEEPQGDGELADMDEVSTKLDLARAYVDMGDPDGAKSILDEVMEEGNEDQKDEARGILEQMA